MEILGRLRSCSGLGHTSIKTTRDRYGHLMPDAFQGIGERLEAVLDGNWKATALRVA